MFQFILLFLSVSSLRLSITPLKWKYLNKSLRSAELLSIYTVMILSFRTDMPRQIVQTQIREEQSDQGLHCLPFRLHHLDSLLYGRATSSII